MCAQNFVKLVEISLTEVPLKDVTVFRATTFLNEALLQIYFFGIYDLFKITNITTAKWDFDKK